MYNLGLHRPFALWTFMCVQGDSGSGSLCGHGAASTPSPPPPPSWWLCGAFDYMSLLIDHLRLHPKLIEAFSIVPTSCSRSLLHSVALFDGVGGELGKNMFEDHPCGGASGQFSCWLGRCYLLTQTIPDCWLMEGRQASGSCCCNFPALGIEASIDGVNDTPWCWSLSLQDSWSFIKCPWHILFILLGLLFYFLWF